MKRQLGHGLVRADACAALSRLAAARQGRAMPNRSGAKQPHARAHPAGDVADVSNNSTKEDEGRVVISTKQ